MLLFGLIPEDKFFLAIFHYFAPMNGKPLREVIGSIILLYHDKLFLPIFHVIYFPLKFSFHPRVHPTSLPCLRVTVNMDLKILEDGSMPKITLANLTNPTKYT